MPSLVAANVHPSKGLAASACGATATPLPAMERRASTSAIAKPRDRKYAGAHRWWNSMANLLSDSLDRSGAGRWTATELGPLSRGYLGLGLGWVGSMAVDPDRRLCRDR